MQIIDITHDGAIKVATESFIKRLDLHGWVYNYQAAEFGRLQFLKPGVEVFTTKVHGVEASWSKPLTVAAAAEYKLDEILGLPDLRKVRAAHHAVCAGLECMMLASALRRSTDLPPPLETLVAQARESRLRDQLFVFTAPRAVVGWDMRQGTSEPRLCVFVSAKFFCSISAAQ